MVKKFIVTRPNWDIMTSYLYDFSKEIIKSVKETKDIHLTSIENNEVNRINFENSVKKENPKLIFLNGHGDKKSVAGHENEIILDEKNINLAKEELKNFERWPVIIKRVHGTWGEYVEKAENLNEAVRIIKKFWKKGAERLPIVAQEFIRSPSYRVTVIGDKIVQTAIKENIGWKSTGVYEKKFKKFDIVPELESIIKKVVKFSGINICGIDLLKKDNCWFVLEINSQPGLDFFINEREKLLEEILDFRKNHK